jgi:hypothetical protein
MPEIRTRPAGPPGVVILALPFVVGEHHRVASYTNFFVGSTTVAGALAGLLFVALSVAPERLMGATASTEQQAIAATAFTALVDALWISLVALRPGNVLPGANLVLGLLGLTSTVGLAIRLWRARAEQKLSRRWPYLLLFIMAVYVGQIVAAITARSAASAQSAAGTLVLVFFAVGIARSWELLGLRGGGLMDLLVGHAQSVIELPRVKSGDGRGPDA